MKQFNLSEWLKDKSRKVVTRRGNPVRIICTDRKHGEDELPIVFLEECNGGEFLLTCKSDGRDGSSKDYDTPYDLFFADEKNELTDFEKEILNLLNCATPEGHGAPTIEKTKEYSQKLLDLAKKEIEKEDWRPSLRTYKNGYEQGKQDVLKRLPKWKKCGFHNNTSVVDGLLYYHDYYIDYEELFEILPKEEETDE